MFRKMRRFKQQLETEECIEILKNEPRGVLSLIGDEGYPYGIPMTHWYCEDNNRIYFHGAGEGHKIDALNRCDKVSFCVLDSGFRNEGEWALNIKSVVVFGRMKPVFDDRKKLWICKNLCYKFTDDAEYVEREIKSSADRVMCLELIPEHMSGKLVNES